MSQATGTSTLTKKDYKAILRAVFPARRKWWWIGLELGLDTSELDSIKGSDEECLREMISTWLNKRTLNPSWQSILEALRSTLVGHEGVAADIEEKFVTAGGSEIAATGLQNPSADEDFPPTKRPRREDTVHTPQYPLSLNEVKDPETGEEYQRIVPGTSQDPPPGYRQEDELVVESTTVKELVSCPKHLGEQLKIYCKDCQELICSDCALSLHRVHQYVLVARAFPIHLETVDKALQDLDSCTGEIENQSMEIKASITKRFDRLHQALGQRREELVSQLEHITERKLKSLAAQRDQTELLKAKLSGCLEFTEESLEGDALAKADPDRLHPLESADLLLVEDDAPTLAEACHNFATFLSTTIDSTHCYTTGTGLKMATVGEEAEVSLHVKDKEGKGVEVQTEDIDVRLVSYKTGHCSVKSVGKGEYKLQYRPNTRGKHHLNITIKGRKTKESPHALVIRPRLQDLHTPVMVIENLRTPKGITTDSNGRIIVSEAGAYCITIFTPEGEKVQSFGSWGSGQGQFSYPCGVTVDKDDNIYVADYDNRIQKFTPKGEHVISVGHQGGDPLQFNHPYHMAFNPTDEKLYICDGKNDRVQILNTDLDFCSAVNGRQEGKGKFSRPQGVAFDGDGNVHITCGTRIQVFTPKGKYVRTIGSKGDGPGQLYNAEGIAVDQDKVFVADFQNNRVSIFTTAGQFLHSFGSQGEEPGQFTFPRGMTIDGNGYILVADNNRRIQIF